MLFPAPVPTLVLILGSRFPNLDPSLILPWESRPLVPNGWYSSPGSFGVLVTSLFLTPRSYCFLERTISQYTGTCPPLP